MPAPVNTNNVAIPPNPYPSINNQYWSALCIDCAAANPPLDPTYMGAIMVQESSGNPNAVNSANANGSVDYGLMQINSANLTQFPDAATDPYANIQAGVTIFSQNMRATGGDYPTAAARYNGGANGPNTAAGQNYVNAVDKHYEQTNPDNETIADQTANFRGNKPTPAPQAEQSTPSQTPSTTAQPIEGQQVDAATANQALNGPSLQIDEGLSETPWYKDQSLITGNPRIRQSVQPISFTVYLDQTNPSVFLHVPQTTEPISLQLNCSLNSFTIESKHVYTRTPSRTGMHVTFWGMTPDLITGSGSTGVFMNQYGITDYFSTLNVPSSVRAQVQAAFSSPAQSTQANLALSNTNPEAFRVAAQDAFVEFLKLFQMNGVVWFNSPNYKGYQTGQDQQGPNAFSPKTGATTFQQTNRNNDVMTRGYVAFQFRQNVYLGYFKSLSWTQDAEKPFSWNFQFAFQVEKTISALFYPNATVTRPTQVVQGFQSPGTLTLPPPPEI